MQLRELIRNVEVVDPAESPETEISGIAYDSRQVRSGYLFAAIRGARTDGNRFVDQAIQRGAGAILSENPRPSAVPRPWIRVEHGRRALAQTAANYFGHPTRDLRLVGVTGTNGKTSTAYLLESILRTGSSRVGLISTIAYRSPGWSAPAGLTTPESLDLQGLFRRFQQNGCRQVVMEVSSHALDLDRVFASRFEVAVFTNLSPEHLDYHESMDGYYRAKKQLFVDTGYGPPEVSVVNVDDVWGQKLAGSIPGRCLTFSLSRPADFGVLECSCRGCRRQQPGSGSGRPERWNRSLSAHPGPVRTNRLRSVLSGDRGLRPYPGCVAERPGHRQETGLAEGVGAVRVRR